MLNEEINEGVVDQKLLKELIPVCANCMKIRTPQENWVFSPETIANFAGNKFTHTICPDCLIELYPEFC